MSHLISRRFTVHRVSLPPLIADIGFLDHELSCELIRLTQDTEVAPKPAILIYDELLCGFSRYPNESRHVYCIGFYCNYVRCIPEADILEDQGTALRLSY